MRNEFLDELKSIAMESVGVEVTVDPYAGSEVAEELVTLDIIDANAVAMESYEEALFAEAFEAQELALESAELSFSDITKFNGELSMESVTNAVKRGAYGAQIQIKKVIQKIIKFVVSIYDYFTVADGKFKSYNKLLKKYREKLGKTNPSAHYNEDKEEKEITIRKWTGLSDSLTAFTTGVDALGLKGIATALVSGDLQKVITSFAGIKIGDHQLISDATLANEESDEDIKDALRDVKETLKEKHSDAKTDWNDTEELKFDEAKSRLMELSNTLMKGTAKDVKFKGDLAKIRKAADKFKSKATDKDSVKLQRLNKLIVPTLTIVKMTLTKDYKTISSGLQGVLADMAKVISAGTKIND